MYNGIGLPTPRGSGTNGYVQRNLASSYKSKDKNSFKSSDNIVTPSLKKPNFDIIEHDRKRKIEVKCLEFQSMLEDQGYSQNEIYKRVATYRQSLSEENTKEHRDKHGRILVKETHELAEAQLRKNEKLREAFGISEYFVEGSSFDPERHNKEAAARAVIEETKKYSIISSPSSSENELFSIEKRVESSPKIKKRSKKSSSRSIEIKKKKKKKHGRKSASSSTEHDRKTMKSKVTSNKKDKKIKSDSPSPFRTNNRRKRSRSQDYETNKKKIKDEVSYKREARSNHKSCVSCLDSFNECDTNLMESDEDNRHKKKERSTDRFKMEKKRKYSPSAKCEVRKTKKESLLSPNVLRDNKGKKLDIMSKKKICGDKEKHKKKKSNKRWCSPHSKRYSFFLDKNVENHHRNVKKIDKRRSSDESVLSVSSENSRNHGHRRSISKDKRKYNASKGNFIENSKRRRSSPKKCRNESAQIESYDDDDDYQYKRYHHQSHHSKSKLSDKYCDRSTTNRKSVCNSSFCNNNSSKNNSSTCSNSNNNKDIDDKCHRKQDKYRKAITCSKKTRLTVTSSESSSSSSSQSLSSSSSSSSETEIIVHKKPKVKSKVVRKMYQKDFELNSLGKETGKQMTKNEDGYNQSKSHFLDSTYSLESAENSSLRYVCKNKDENGCDDVPNVEKNDCAKFFKTKEVEIEKEKGCERKIDQNKEKERNLPTKFERSKVEIRIDAAGTVTVQNKIDENEDTIKKWSVPQSTSRTEMSGSTTENSIVEPTKNNKRDGSTSSSLSYSPMEKYPYRYQDILGDKSKKNEKQNVEPTLQKQENNNTITISSKSDDRLKREIEFLNKFKSGLIEKTMEHSPKKNTLINNKGGASESLCLEDVPLPPETNSLELPNPAGIDSINNVEIEKINISNISAEMNYTQIEDVPKTNLPLHIPASTSLSSKLSKSTSKNRSSVSSSDSSPKKKFRSISASSSSSSESSLSSQRSKSNSSSSSCSRSSSHIPKSRKKEFRSFSSSLSSSESSNSRSRSRSVSRGKKRRRRLQSDSDSYSSSRSRSVSIPRRKGSPSFLERRRITSRRKYSRSSSSLLSSLSSSSSSFSSSSS